VVAGELGFAYASVCVVDNLASGLRSGPLTGREVAVGRALTQADLAKVLDAIVPSLAAQSS
jgi:purine nucleoside phosphorylase